MQDVSFVVELCSLCHQTYADFAPALLDLMKKLLPTKKTDPISNMSKLRTDLRLFAELIAIGEL